MKSSTKGYASFDYELIGYRESKLQKMDILLNGDVVDALSSIVHKDFAYSRGKVICEKLKEIIADVLNVEADDITEDTKFVDDLGADSLDIFQIIMGIEETSILKLIMMRLKRSQQSEMRLSRSKKQQITRMLGVKKLPGFFILWGRL